MLLLFLEIPLNIILPSQHQVLLRNSLTIVFFLTLDDEHDYILFADQLLKYRNSTSNQKNELISVNRTK